MDEIVFHSFIKTAMELQSDDDTPYNYTMVKAAIEAKYGITKEAASESWIRQMTASGARKSSNDRINKFIGKRGAASRLAQDAEAHRPVNMGYTPHTNHVIRSNFHAASQAQKTLVARSNIGSREGYRDMSGLSKKAHEFPQSTMSRGRRFMQAAKSEAGPAGGAVLGAGLANAYGVSPLAGAAAGYGLGALPEIIHGIRHRV